MKLSVTSFMTKKIVSIILILLLLAGMNAVAESSPLKFYFQKRMLVSYVGAKLKLTAFLKNPSQLKEEITVQLTDQNNLVLAEAKMLPRQKEVSFGIALTDELFGKHLVTVSLNGEQLSVPLYVAIGNKKAPILTGITTDEKVVSITMDFAYGEPDTKAYFDLFDKYGIRITCFFTGNYAQKHPDLIRYIAERGHDIGDHSMTHPHNADLSGYDRYLQITMSKQAIYDACGIYPTFYRPPFGEYSQDIKAFAMVEDMTVVMWSLSSGDSDPSNSEEWSYKHLTNHIEPGQIILFHNDGKYTLNVLKRLIPWALEQGYRFVPISELMTLGPWRAGTSNK